ncbi:GntP family permease [Actinobacillus pleuropneumoniae]|uniref:Gluconate permease n=1 Tax=Actinobacillus pleuropneumoniae serotype 3 (strain JL03) TaxID=434271 RepID=B0BS91_ACTPJ|nr:GntP family permease [Actinobacillus pleuropneumoniae]ABY70248.1 gluconate permease [Actinobacillus pleuropneumoniae serovar 3 str. JL03]EFM99954.1 Low-affinity gluconate/H+ symporter GntU [Actinobacillus pleuropneumoniae serovar 12 str. 1096]MBT9319304.1 GntP family permease [Actinobacillus pleuropneumoniae]MBT9344094.1 GntP family permease [Actinobacillus pleuropneumoniae]UKH15166.1 GntP family permease [Actinobacillus pleuropneumoniae]
MLIFIMVVAIIALLVLIIKFKVHAFVALLIVSLLTALAAGIPVDKILPTLLTGFGNTLASVALLVGLGAMIGRLLEITGGAKVLADTLINKFGEQKAPFALGVAALLFGFPIFFDAGLVVMLPIVFSVAKQFGGSVLRYAFPVAGAFAVMHAFLPPHPGPVASGDLLGVNMGLLVLVGLICAIPTWYIGTYLFSMFISKRVHVELPKAFLNAAAISETSVQAPPSFGRVLFILVLPIFLILFDTGLNTLSVAKVIDGSELWVQSLRLIGKTPVALLITLLLAIMLLRGERSYEQIESLCNNALGPICSIILVTGAGGMFGGVLRASGIGDVLSSMLSDTGMPIIVAAFIIAVAMRVAQGSATVALTTAAALIAPSVAASTDLSQFDLCFIVIAIASGATVLSHVNDSGFWLMSRFLEMDTKTTLKTWTALETSIGVVGFIIALIGSILL